jgi:hypothetical protein
MTVEQKADDDCQPKERHAVFVLQTNPRKESEDRSQSLIAGFQYADEKPSCTHSERRLESVHRIEIVEDEKNWSDADGKTCKELYQPAPGEFTNDEARHVDERPHRRARLESARRKRESPITPLCSRSEAIDRDG